MLSKRKRLYYIILSCPLNLCEIGTSEKRKIGINEVSTCTCPTFQSHIIFIHLVLQVGFLKKQALRWRLMSTVYWGVLLGSTPVGEGNGWKFIFVKVDIVKLIFITWEEITTFNWKEIFMQYLYLFMSCSVPKIK